MARLAFLFALTMSISALADFGGLDFIKAVVNSSQLAQAMDLHGNVGWGIKSVERTATFRCPGCYQFAVRIEKFDEATGLMKRKSIQFMTTLDSGNIVVSAQKN